jgi:hypothetical protein
VTDGTQELEAGVWYHGLTTFSCGGQEPEVQALGQCEDIGEAGCVGSFSVEVKGDRIVYGGDDVHNLLYP